MKRALTLVLLSSVLFSLPSHALEALDDAELSNKTGQDGLTIGITGDGIMSVDHIRYIDKDGFTASDHVKSVSTTPTDFTNQAGLSVNFAGDIRSCTGTASATCSLAAGTSTIIIDADGGNGSNSSTNNSFVNIGFTGVATAFYIPLKSISLVTGTNNKGTWSNGEGVKILEFKDSSGTSDGAIAVNMTNALSANIQLGAQPQGSMMLIGENTVGIDFGTLHFLSYGALAANNSKLSTQVKVEGIKFDGIGVDISGTDGLVTKINGETEIASVDVNNTVFGTVGAQSADTFNNLQNASIGNISMKNIKIQNLNVSVKGL